MIPQEYKTLHFLKPLTILLMAFLFVINTYSGQENLQQLKKQLENASLDTNYISINSKIGDAFFYAGKNDSATFYWEIAKEKVLWIQQLELTPMLSFTLNDKLSVLYNDLAYLKIANGKFNSAIDYFNKCVLLKRKINDLAGEIQTYTNIGYLYINKNQIDSAIFYNEIAYKLAKENNLDEETAISGMQIGVLKTKAGYISEALKNLEETESLFIAGNNEKGLAICYNNIAQAYEEIDENNTALEYFFKSLKLKIETKNLKGAANTYNNIGACYQKMEEPGLALIYSKKALYLFKEMENKVGEATTLNNLGIIKLEQKQQDSALIYFKQSLAIRETIKDIEGIAISQLNISKILTEQQQYKQAIRILKNSYKTALEINKQSLIADCTYQLYLNYIGLKDYKNALSNFEKHTKASDILFSEENLKRAAQIQNKKKIREQNYQDSINIVLFLENNEVKWKEEIEDLNFIIGKTTIYWFSVALLLVVLGLVYFIRKQPN